MVWRQVDSGGYTTYDCMILAFCSHVRQLQSGWVSQADIFANTGDEPMLQSESPPPAGGCC